MNLKIDEDYRRLLPELSSAEYETLEKDIVKHGVLSPLLVWNETIIDGHNRYSICQKHNIENFPIKEITFQSKDDAMSWILSHQLGRRNLTDFQRNEIALKYQAVIAKRMREKMSAGGGDQKSNKRKIGDDQKIHPEKTRKTTARQELANIANTSEASIQRTKLILEKGTPEQIEQVRSGKVSITGMWKQLRGEQPGKTEAEKKTCISCGEEYPVRYFQKGRNECKYCRNKAHQGTFRDVKGNVIPIGKEYDHIDDDQIVGRLYGKADAITVTIDDVVEEFLVNAKTYIESLRRIINSHKDLAESNRETIEKIWDKAGEMLLSAKEDCL